MFTTIQISSNDKKSIIDKTCKILARYGLVVFPSDTVYGLLVDATNENAVKKLIRFKNRPFGKAISVFVADFNMLQSVAVLPQENSKLLHHLIPGPFTVILQSRHSVSKLLESERGTVGVRITNYPFVQELVEAFGKPVTATSANLAGRSPHYSVSSFLNQLSVTKKKLIDLIIDAETLPRNKPSTVVDLSSSSLKILRRGDIVSNKSDEYISKSPAQTQKLGKFLAEKSIKNDDNKPVVFILQGDLGSGKTVLTKGIASYFGIENIISPTFVVYYEYEIKVTSYKLSASTADRRVTSFKKFVHVDLYNIEDEEEFEHLGLENYLMSGNIMVIEWGEKLGELYKRFKEKAKVIFIRIIYRNENEREIMYKKITSS